MRNTKEHGVEIVDGIEVGATQQCCHCGNHFRPMKKFRAFCRNCMQPTCGNPMCDVCIPFLAKLEQYEKGIIKVI